MNRCGTTLAEHARLFAVDLPGFGASERRADLLTPRAMGDFLARLIEEADLERPHLVAPDVGCTAALFAAAAHPERIAGLVVGEGGAAVPIDLGEPLRSWVLEPDLDKYRDIDPDVFVEAAMDTVEGGVSDEMLRRLPLVVHAAIALSNRCATSARIRRSCPSSQSSFPADRDAGDDHQRTP